MGNAAFIAGWSVSGVVAPGTCDWCLKWGQSVGQYASLWAVTVRMGLN